MKSNPIKGKVLFYTIWDTTRQMSCASCHSAEVLDTFSFFPSVYDLAEAVQQQSFEMVKSKLNEPYMHSALLSDMHSAVAFSDDSIEAIIQYIKTFKDKTRPVKTSVSKTETIALVGGLLLLVAFVIRRRANKLWIGAFVVSGLSFLSYSLVLGIQRLNYQQGYSPAQPVKFSHKVHAGDNRIDCMYCHHSANKSAKAGTPSVSLCLNCHLVVREGTRSGAFELNKLFAKWDSLQTTPWVRVHQLPAFAHFSHAVHLRNKKTACADCHGSVESMHQITQVNNLSMKWCLDCHTEKKVYAGKTVSQVIPNFYYLRKDTMCKVEGTKMDCIYCHY